VTVFTDSSLCIDDLIVSSRVLNYFMSQPYRWEPSVPDSFWSEDRIAPNP
jgi:hypothetical protein